MDLREREERKREGERGSVVQNSTSIADFFSLSQLSPSLFNTSFLFYRFLSQTMAVGKNKRVSKRGKGGRKKAYVQVPWEERQRGTARARSRCGGGGSGGSGGGRPPAKEPHSPVCSPKPPARLRASGLYLGHTRLDLVFPLAGAGAMPREGRRGARGGDALSSD